MLLMIIEENKFLFVTFCFNRNVYTNIDHINMFTINNI